MGRARRPLGHLAFRRLHPVGDPVAQRNHRCRCDETDRNAEQRRPPDTGGEIRTGQSGHCAHRETCPGNPYKYVLAAGRQRNRPARCCRRGSRRWPWRAGTARGTRRPVPRSAAARGSRRTISSAYRSARARGARQRNRVRSWVHANARTERGSCRREFRECRRQPARSTGAAGVDVVMQQN